MRLSDAIALGQHLIKRDPTTVLRDGCGCAIGMGLAAIGKTDARADYIVDHFPWVWKNNAFVEISMMFSKVCQGLMTLDQLIDRVREMEPPELEESRQEEVEPIVEPNLVEQFTIWTECRR